MADTIHLGLYGYTIYFFKNVVGTKSIDNKNVCQQDAFDKNPFHLVALVTGHQKRSIKCTTTLTTFDFSRYLAAVLSVCLKEPHHGRPNRF